MIKHQGQSQSHITIYELSASQYPYELRSPFTWMGFPILQGRFLIGQRSNSSRTSHLLLEWSRWRKYWDPSGIFWTWLQLVVWWFLDHVDRVTLIHNHVVGLSLNISFTNSGQQETCHCILHPHCLTSSPMIAINLLPSLFLDTAFIYIK